MHKRAPHHTLKVDARLGALHLCATLACTAPWTVIFGPSGSGKSSLLRAICGWIPASFDRFEAEPTRRIELSATQPHQRRLAYAPQAASLLPHLTVRENVAFAQRLRSSDIGDAASVDAALALFELTPLAHRRPMTLSGGERQRVNLARALAVPQPRLLLLDEPFSGIDRALRDVLLQRLRSTLAERATPAVLVTHDIEEALQLDAEVVRLEDGRVLAQGPARSVLAAERQRALLHLN